MPLETALPKKMQNLIPFGGAASMVHPASGYMLSKVLDMAPRLADLISTHEGRKDELKNALDMIWPQERRRCRELYLVGLEILTRMPPQRYYEFFDAFSHYQTNFGADSWTIPCQLPSSLSHVENVCAFQKRAPCFIVAKQCFPRLWEPSEGREASLGLRRGRLCQ